MVFFVVIECLRAYDGADWQSARRLANLPRIGPWRYTEEIMTTEERFERIEHVTFGLAEERRKDREEFRALWRDTQRQLNELTVQVVEVDDRLGKRIEALAEEAAARDRETDRRFRETDRRFRETDARIDKLVVAIGEFMARQPNPQS